ncbi:MAG: DUF192 domain-containing protein [Lentimicrobiaceae bacterium]|nr:DUF192 domain-containing protein [Lentimicrobiaceae bacterium]
MRILLSDPFIKTPLWAMLLVAVIAACQPDRKPSSPSAPSAVTTAPAFEPEANLAILTTEGDTLIQVRIELAEDEFEQERGLMYRHFLPPDAGMLFIFPEERYRSFWMKNTHISLDIIYLDRNFVIQSIHPNTVPFSESSVPSDLPAQYVLEVNAGFADMHGVTPGMRVSYKRIN